MAHGVLDCCVRQAWAADDEVFAYLDEGWRQYMAANVPPAWHDHLVGLGERPAGPLISPMTVVAAHHNPLGNYRPLPDGTPMLSPSGDGYRRMLVEHLDRTGAERALLCPDKALQIPGIPTTKAAVALTRAINDWTIDRWLSLDPRLRGLILVTTQVPEAAAEEIRRAAARDERMVGVVLGTNGLARPFGHAAYDPIFAAAHEAGLFVVVHSGAESSVESPGHPTGGGMPNTYTEMRVLGWQSLMSHAASIISQGVVLRYPEMRFLLLGAGATWVTPWLWRLDNNHRAFRFDVVWLDGLPSDYFYDRFRVGTHPAAARPEDVERIAAYLAVEPRLAGTLCYASGLPDADCTTPEEVAAQLPEGWGDQVFGTNAAALFAAREASCTTG